MRQLPPNPQVNFPSGGKAALLVLALLLTSAFALHAELTLRRADAMTRVSRTAEFHEALRIEICAARGEWESFQIVVSGSPEELKDITVESSPLTGKDDAKIPVPAVLREHYVKVERSTPMSPLPPGDYADALVPQSFPWQELPNVKRSPPSMGTT